MPVVKLITVEASDTLVEYAHRFASAARIKSAGRYVKESDRLLSYAAEFALCCAIHRERLSPVEYSYSPSGKPMIEGGFMSLSHSGILGVCAFSELPVGVDIERLRNISDSLSKRILCPEELSEYTFISEADEKNRYLLSRWVDKESYLKLTGEGLSKGISGLYCSNSSISDGSLSAFVSRLAMKVNDTDYLCSVCAPEQFEILHRHIAAQEVNSIINRSFNL